jgi:hypothetical protein
MQRMTARRQTVLSVADGRLANEHERIRNGARIDALAGLVSRVKMPQSNDTPSLTTSTLEQVVMTARSHRKRRLATSFTRLCSFVAVAALALALASAHAFGGSNKPAAANTQSHTLVAYTEEQGGVLFRLASLTVSTRGQATVRFEACVQRFHPRTALWRKLKAAVKQTNVHALAGNHVPATPRADASTWVIVVGRDWVRITAPSIPPALRVKLEPLLNVLGEVLSIGERRMPQSCSSKRIITSTR